MSILEQGGMMLFSVIHIPIEAMIIACLFIPMGLLFSTSTTIDAYLQPYFGIFAMVLMEVSGSVGTLLILIPYLTAIFVDNMFTTYDLDSILWYSGVAAATAGFNIGSAGAFYWYGSLV